MDNQQQQRINRAAQEFTDALVAAYKTTSDSTVVAQQLGAQQIEYFFDTVINNLRTQAEGTLQVTQQLATQQELARESAQDLAQMSTDNYMDLLDSMFSFYQGGTSRTLRQERRKPRYALRRPKGAGAKPRGKPKRPREALRKPTDGLRKPKRALGQPKDEPERPKGAPRRQRNEPRRLRDAPWKPRGVPRWPKGAGAKPRTRGTLKRVTTTPRRSTARRASGCGPPAGLRYGVGTPDLGDGPHVEDRVRFPCANAQEAESLVARWTLKPNAITARSR